MLICRKNKIKQKYKWNRKCVDETIFSDRSLRGGNGSTSGSLVQMELTLLSPRSSRDTQIDRIEVWWGKASQILHTMYYYIFCSTFMLNLNTYCNILRYSTYIWKESHHNSRLLSIQSRFGFSNTWYSWLNEPIQFSELYHTI